MYYPLDTTTFYVFMFYLWHTIAACFLIMIAIRVIIERKHGREI